VLHGDEFGARKNLSESSPVTFASSGDGVAVKKLTEEFCEALWRGDAQKVRRLVSRIEPNAEDRWHRSPLAMAAQYGDVELVRELLARGADVDAGRLHLTPLAYAARRGADEIVRELRDAGAAVSVIAAVYSGDRRAVAEKDLALDEEGTPLLLHAAQSLHLAIAADLLDRGVEVGATDPSGETALHRVANLRRVDGAKAAQMASLLLERKAPVDAVNHLGVTPLHHAVRARNLAVAEVLLANGANPNAADKRGSTPLHRACWSTGASDTAGVEAAPFIELLLEHGADPKVRDKRGRAAGKQRLKRS
jgi:ankyrin repeat protein